MREDEKEQSDQSDVSDEELEEVNGEGKKGDATAPKEGGMCFVG